MYSTVVNCAYLERVVLQNILDVLDGGLQIVQTRSLLVAQLILKLSSQFHVTWRNEKHRLLACVLQRPHDEEL